MRAWGNIAGWLWSAFLSAAHTLLSPARALARKLRLLPDDEKEEAKEKLPPPPRFGPHRLKREARLSFGAAQTLYSVPPPPAGAPTPEPSSRETEPPPQETESDPSATASPLPEPILRAIEEETRASYERLAGGSLSAALGPIGERGALLVAHLRGGPAPGHHLLVVGPSGPSGFGEEACGS